MRMPRDISRPERRPPGAGRAARALLLALGLALGIGGAGWLERRQGESPAAAAATDERVVPPAAQQQVAALPPPPAVPAPAAVQAPAPSAPLITAPPVRPPRHAVFGGRRPPEPVRQVADWAVDSGDHGRRAFAIVDKQDARVWLFGPDGVLVQQVPALLGAAVGDDPVPGIGEKPLSQVRPEEKTTPAGRFVAEPGVNTHGEDIVWVSYDLAVSMHRVRPLVKAERRLQRLASSTSRDNRISFGCINLPVAFYEKVFSPLVRSAGAIIYVLPETRSVREQFGLYEVPPPQARRARGAAAPNA
ncbi:hypothetical protein [Ramlibacter sp.]|uniref:hypothetical protein n=1 Tax=Ramlibacter sp. TaxID=1917967 RepID=UPI002D25353B|nr:hypothetical protein [Ramlibacter sp.]HYD74737.1 hypothetical protein [Ramlibacter sp.]